MILKHSTGRPVVVLGMHRSGTSSVTGLLEQCGAWLGRDTELTGSNKENPKGFFERRDMRNICDALLFSAGADWWKIADFHIGRIPKETLTKQGALFEVLAETMSAHGTWAVKEPRLCLLFPVLRSYLDDPVCVVVTRNPLETAKSLRTRNGFSLFHGLALWEMYMRGALAASRDCPRLFVSYNRLVAEPEAEAGALVDALTAEGVHGLSLPADIGSFISPGLRHESSQVSEAEAFLMPAQKRLWQAISTKEAPASQKGAASLNARLFLRDFEIQQAKKEQDFELYQQKHASRETKDKKATVQALSVQLRAAQDLIDQYKAKDADERLRKLTAQLPEVQERIEKNVVVERVKVDELNELHGLVARLEATRQSQDKTIRSLRRKLRRTREEPMKSLRRKYATRLLRVLAKGASQFSGRYRTTIQSKADARDPRRDDDVV